MRTVDHPTDLQQHFHKPGSLFSHQTKELRGVGGKNTVPGGMQRAELRTIWVTQSFWTLKAKPLKQTLWEDISQKTSNVPNECWQSSDDFQSTETKRPGSFILPRLLCLPQTGSLTPSLTAQGARSLPGLSSASHDRRVRSRHMPQIKQHQATFCKQHVNMDVIWICDGQSGWQGAL